MAKSTTYKGAVKPFGKSGHFDESMRHALQAKGIKTGRFEATVSLSPLAYNQKRLFKSRGDAEEWVMNKRDAQESTSNPFFGFKIRKLRDSDHDGVPDKYDCAPHDPTRQDFQAGEVLRQLGGNRFIAMTGAKDFVKDDTQQKISFKIGRNAKSINYVTITLNPMDTYDMEFLMIRGGKITVKSEAKGIYNDQLEDVFTENTGLYTQL